MRELKQAAAAWEPIDLALHPAQPVWNRWGEDALVCLQLNRTCAFCPLHKIFGYTWGVQNDKKCLIPLTVQSFLNRKIAFTKTPFVKNF